MQLDQVIISDYQKRIQEYKKKVVLKPHEICIERAKLITDSYKMTKGEHPTIRFAKAMNHFLSNMTIKIWDDEVIVGNRSMKYVGTPLFPEIRIDTIEQDVLNYKNRDVQSLEISDEDIQFVLNEIIPYWKNEDVTVRKRFMNNLTPDAEKVMGRIVFTVDTEMTNGFGHFLPGHANVLKYGLNGLLLRAENKLKEFSGSDKVPFLESVIIQLKASKHFIKRFSNLAKKIATNESNELRKKELLEISKTCENISEETPKTFKEALQLIHFTHLISGLEDGGFAISIGRLDQLLYPYYKKDIEQNEIKKKEVAFILNSWFIKLSTLWNYVFSQAVVAAEGPPIAENVTIGGLDREGNDVTNELSYLILDAYTYVKTVQPTFSVRVNKNTPSDFLAQVGESIKSGASIALFNDEIMIKGLQARGFALEDAREYAPIGCVEPQHPQKSFGSTNANQFNIVKCLELALSNGMDLASGVRYGVQNQKSIQTYSDLWDNFVEQTSYFVKYMVLSMEALDKAFAELNPQPFLSATIDDCIERGLDLTQGGAVYDFTGPQLIGLATAADSLAVIKKFVFEEKILPLEDLVKMLRKNYKGRYLEKKAKEWRQLFINKVPKFGNDEDSVDQIAVEIANLYCNEISKYSNYRGGKYNPGIYSTSLHLGFGVFTSASADGRKLGDALSNGVGPTHGMDKNGPTAILKSVMKLPNELMTNGNSLILDFHPNSLNIEKFPPLIKTFFESNGGYHVQFNVVGKETLLDAQKNPQNYRNLVIRIAGYSVYFTELSKSAQNDVIARTQYSL